MRFKQLERLDEEAIEELDRDIAEQFFIQNRSKGCSNGFMSL
jgi:hypothetical protein